MSGPGTPRRSRQLAAKPEPGRRRQPSAHEPARQKTALSAERGAAAKPGAAGHHETPAPMPRLTGLRLTAETGPRPAPAVALAALREGAPGVAALPLPHRPRLEERFGLSFAGEKVLSGSAVAGALDRLGAEAAEIDGRLYLRSPAAPLPVVAHELVHRLQRQGAPASETAAAPAVLAEGSAAETEAHRLAREGGAPETKLGAGSLALLRQATAEEKAETAAARRPASEAAPQKNAPPPKPAKASPARSEAPPASGGSGAKEPGAQAQDAAALAAPAPVETRLSPEEQARRDAELQAAKDKLAAAQNGGDLIEAFAAAPPSVKAATQSGLGGRLGEIQAQDQKKLEKEIPALEVKMGGEPVANEKALAAPPPREVELEPKRPAASELPKLDPLAAAEKFLANASLGSTLKNLFGAFTSLFPSQDAVEEGFEKVATTDPDVETSPGEKPKIPLQKGTETDPGRIDEQNGNAVGEARAGGRAAQQAVLAGKGPEAAQLKELSEQRRVGELKQPTAPRLEGAPGAELFHRLPLGEEVRARFDLDQQASMQQNLGPARELTRQAEEQRDQGRQAQLDQAEDQRSAAVESADRQQRQQVQQARTQIQRQRQSTLEAQGKAVGKLETDAEQERTSSMGTIEKRVDADEKAISVEYDAKEKLAEKEVEEGEKEAEAAKQKGKNESEEGEGWWSRAQTWVTDRLADLGSLIGKVFDRVRGAVKGLLDKARAFAKDVIDQAAGFIKDTVAACGKVLKGFVDFALKDTFPGLAKTLNDGIDSTVAVVTTAVDKVAEDLKAGVDTVVDRLEKGIDTVLDVFEGAAKLGLGLLQAAVTGDWGAVLRMGLEAALKVAGIEPAEFYAFAAKVLDTLGLILGHPVQFLENVVAAVKRGFELFGANFFVHLQQGLIAWLTGSLGGNIRIPEKFDVRGLLSLAAQLLGLTGEWLKERAAEAIGKKNVERLEWLYSHVETLANDGFSGLFAKISGELAGLRDLVLGQIADFLTRQVIRAAGVWVVSIASGAGVLAKALQTVWNLYKFLRDQLQRILAVVRSVVGALDKIAHGATDFAGAKIEMALGSLVAVAIHLFATAIPINGVVEGVREILKSVREAITKAALNLLAKLAATFQGKGARAQRPDPTDPEMAAQAEAQDSETIGVVLPVPFQGETHHLRIVDAGNTAVVQLESLPTPVEVLLANWKKALGQIPADRVAEADQWIAEIEILLKPTHQQADAIALARGKTLESARTEEKREELDKLEKGLTDEESQIASLLIQLLPLFEHDQRAYSVRFQKASALPNFSAWTVGGEWTRAWTAEFGGSVSTALLDRAWGLDNGKLESEPLQAGSSLQRYRLKQPLPSDVVPLAANFVSTSGRSHDLLKKDSGFTEEDLTGYIVRHERLPHDEAVARQFAPAVIALLLRQKAIRHTDHEEIYTFEIIAAMRNFLKSWLGDGKIRSTFYDAESGWTTVRDEIRVKDFSRFENVVTAYERAQLDHDEPGTAVAVAEWEDLRREGVGQNVDLRSLGPAERAYFKSPLNGSKFHVDHKTPVAAHWTYEGGNNCDQTKRKTFYTNPDNLRLTWHQVNLSKNSGGTNYHGWVGPDFTSQYQNGDPGIVDKITRFDGY